MGKQNSLIDYRDSEDKITFTVKRPSARYIDEFLSLDCAADLAAWRVYPNAKEITESFAAYNAVRRVMQSQLKDPNVLVICVGDGNTPRTAACFAVRSAWTAWSVDPRLKEPTGWGQRIRRLGCFAECIEYRDTYWARKMFATRVVVAVHSHAALPQVEKFQPSLVVAIPCCVPQTYQGRPPDREYADWGIWSPERTVKVWFGNKPEVQRGERESQ